MQIVKGMYNEAKVFTDVLDDACIEQIKGLCDLEVFKDAQIRIMPDCHAGASCVIGFTANLGEKIIPNIVGVDIGCGMLTIPLGKIDIEMERLDKVIHEKIPSGRNVHPGRIARCPELQDLCCYRELKDSKNLERSCGTLGGGNHFIEVDIDEKENKYLIIHTGSRNLGKQVANIYQKKATLLHTGWGPIWYEEEKIKKEFKETGRRAEIQEALKELHRNAPQTAPDMPLEYCFLDGKYSEMYLHDMKICQEFAEKNRNLIADLILENYGFSDGFKRLTTIHNYIDHDSNIVRKGAVSAKKDEELLIPINMRDGSLLCVGKGNEDWNCSAPHGAGRLFSIHDAKQRISLEEYQDAMKGIYSTSVDRSTICESPMAYKGMKDIVDNIAPTADIIAFLKPIYNFKATGFVKDEASDDDTDNDD